MPFRWLSRRSHFDQTSKYVSVLDVRVRTQVSRLRVKELELASDRRQRSHAGIGDRRRGSRRDRGRMGPN